MRVLLLLWAWKLRIGCVGHDEGGLCSTWWAFENLELLADEDLTLEVPVGWSDTSMQALSPTPENWYAVASVEFFRFVLEENGGYSGYRKEILKACSRLDNMMPRTRNCCEAAFFPDDDSEEVRVDTTCHDAQTPNDKCYI